MDITSAVFKHGEKIPVKYTCEGPNVSPPLSFHNIPSEAKSLVLFIEDPDAEAKPWVHWVVFNIPPDATGFEEGSIAPGSVEGLCNGNTFGYEGPCPPKDEHRYIFRLMALDKVLDLPAESDRKALIREMKGHVVEEAVLLGFYEKQKVKSKQTK